MKVVKLGKIEITEEELTKFGKGPDLIKAVEVEKFLASHPEWRLPTIDELLKMYNERNTEYHPGKLNNMIPALYLCYGLNSGAKIPDKYSNLSWYNKASSKYFWVNFNDGKLDLDYGNDCFVRLVKTNNQAISDKTINNKDISNTTVTSTEFLEEQNCDQAKRKYLEQNPDVAKAGMDAWNHYTVFGKKEGRKWPTCTEKINNNDSKSDLGNDVYISYFDNGKVECKRNYLNGKLNGEDIRYYKNGKIRRKDNYLNGELNGESLIGNEKGKFTEKGYYIKGIKNGEWIYNNENGKLRKKENYQNGKLNGEWITYYDNDQIQEKGNYLSGVKIGEWIKYFENGRLSVEENYLNGQKNGVRVAYYDTKKETKQLHANYTNGKLNGECIRFYENGEIKFKDNYLNGEKNGLSIIYRENGKILSTANYINGVRKDDEMEKTPTTNSSLSNNTSNSSKVEYMECVSGNCVDGIGTMVFPSNTGFKEYTGTWKKGFMNSHGESIECNNLNCRFVKGKLIFSDGGYYEGSFDNDGYGLYQGYGYLYNANGTYQKGDFFKGVLSGDGEEKTADGIIYKGRYIKGVRQGLCALTYPDGKVEKGRFLEGKFISEKDNVSSAKLDNTISGTNPINVTSYSKVNDAISGKEWMTVNLNITTFRNGDIVPQAKSEKDLIDANANQSPIWCYYNFDPTTETNYGKLYNWYAVTDPRGLMPIGYIIPSVVDWQNVDENLKSFYFKDGNGRAQLIQTEGKEVGSGKKIKHFNFKFEYGPTKEKKYDNVFGVPEPQAGIYWTTGTFQDQYNDRINAFVIHSDGSTEIDKYQRKGACTSVRAIKGDHNYYEGSWIGNLKNGEGTEYYGVPTELKGYGSVSNGDKYIGLWKNGQQDGEGTIISSNGIKKTGLWRKGEFIGEWKFVDNRHKCYQCNINMSKSTKRTEAEITNLKKDAYSNIIGLYDTESYCSSACEIKAEKERKAREEQYARERRNSSQVSSNNSSTNNSNINPQSTQSKQGFSFEMIVKWSPSYSSGCAHNLQLENCKLVFPITEGDCYFTIEPICPKCHNTPHESAQSGYCKSSPFESSCIFKFKTSCAKCNN